MSTDLLHDEAIDWTARAVGLAERAAAEIRDNEDAIPTLSAVIAALRIAEGDLPADELLEWFPEDDDEADCICPPALRSRGGFRGSCPVHGSGGRAR